MCSPSETCMAKTARRRSVEMELAPAAQLDPDTLYSPEELAEPAAALVAKMSLEEEASLC